MSITYSIPSIAPTIAKFLLFYITIFTSIFPAFSAKHKFWKSQPWAGKSNKWFSGLRAQIQTIHDTRSLLIEGQEKYGKQNKIFILPQLLSEPVAMLPSSFMLEISNMPDERIDLDIPIESGVSADRLIGPSIGNGQSVHLNIITESDKQHLPGAGRCDEAIVAENQDWAAVKIYPAMRRTISQGANRAFCGIEVCRNPDFIDNSCDYSMAGFTLGGSMKMIPKFLHPIVHWTFKGMISGPFEACKNRHSGHSASTATYARSETVKDLGSSGMLRGPCILANLNTTVDPSALNEDTIALRVLNLNMASIHSTSITTTNAILDLYSSPKSKQFVAELRNECKSVLAANGGKWTKDAVNSLIRVDSAIRESMRMSAMPQVVTTRMIANPKGVDLSDGIHIPAGVLIAFSQVLLHEDPVHYPESFTEVDAFRFSAPREAYLAQVAESKDPKVLVGKNESLVAVGPDFLGLGAGRHACPGRFFASQEMKLALAHLLLNYDVKIEGGRQPNSDINGFSAPSEYAEILVRLREDR